MVEGQDVDGQEGVGGGVGGYCIAYSAATKQDQGVERAGQDADEPTIAVEEAEEEGANEESEPGEAAQGDRFKIRREQTAIEEAPGTRVPRRSTRSLRQRGRGKASHRVRASGEAAASGAGIASGTAEVKRSRPIQTSLTFALRWFCIG